jgi:hypothetical protein
LIATGFHRSLRPTSRPAPIRRRARQPGLRPREHHRGGVARQHARMRAMPQPQVRSFHAEGLLPALRLFQQHAPRDGLHHAQGDGLAQVHRALSHPARSHQ